MTFDTITNVACIPGTGGTGTNGSGSGGGGDGGGGGPADPRCSDAAFAASNPNICGSAAYLVLKPSSSIIATLGSVQFEPFLYQNGVETPLTSGVLFGTSDPAVFLVGASSGNGTGLTPGNVVVTASYQGLTASAEVTVVDSTIGCNQTPVATAIVIDNSKSMSLSFGGPYISRLAAAKAVATSYAGTILQVLGQPKDLVSIFSFNDTPTQITSGFISNTTLLTSQIASISQSQGDTDFTTALTLAISALNSITAAEKVLLLISDGEQSDTPTAQDILNITSAFTQAGGILICVGVRASGIGFDLLERMATGGFFINAKSSTFNDALGGLSFLKNAVCAGSCVPAGDFYAATAALDYSSYLNWSVISGQTNLLGNGFLDLLPGNGLYVELATDNHPATLQSIDAFTLNPGDSYDVQFSLGGNNEMYTPSANATVKVYFKDTTSGLNIFEHVVTVDWNSAFQNFSFTFVAQYAANVRLYFEQQIAPGYTGDFAGNLLDNIVFKDVSTLAVLLSDDFNEENITYTPPACGDSAARAAIPDPEDPTIAFINYAGGSQLTGETYKYAVSYKTIQGETNLSNVISTATLTPVAFPSQTTLLGNILPDPLLYPPDRITKIRIWRNDASGSSTLYLLAEVNPENINHIDLEDHAQFLARVDTGIIAPVANTTSVAAGDLGHGNVVNCYTPECDPSVAVGVQSPDSSPLPDIEKGGGSSGTQFNSTKQVCLSCAAGQVGSLTPAMSSLTTPSGTVSASDGSPVAFYAFDQNFDTDTNACDAWWLPNMVNPWIQYKFAVAQIPVAYCVAALPSDACTQYANAAKAPTAWVFQGSNDGSTWTTLDTQTGQVFTSNFVQQYPVSNTTAYTYLRVMFTAVDGGNFLGVNIPILELVFYGANAVQVCQSATATSFTSQADADARATAAATQAVNHILQSINCIQGFTSSKSFTASCPCGTLGSSVTKSAAASSTISQSAADDAALALAQTAANAALVCNLSNNSQLINLPDTQNNGPATPYPSVKFVSAFVGNSSHITVGVTGIATLDLGNFDLLLVSPTGKTVLLKQGTPTVGLHFASGTKWNTTFDDAAGSGLPPSSLPTNNISYKPTQVGTNSVFPGCIAANPNYPYGTTLAAVTGDSPNGSWSLWVRSINALGHATTIDSWTLAIS